MLQDERSRKAKIFSGVGNCSRSRGYLCVQQKYALDIITECGLLGAKPSPTPTELNHKLVMADKTNSHMLLTDPSKYRRLVGRLIYLTFTRPDLSYIIQILSQFMQKPLEDHWSAALRVVRYLNGTSDQGIMLWSKCDLQITAYCDADWPSCSSTRVLLVLMLFFLETHWFHGRQRSRERWLDPRLKPNIGPWLIRLEMAEEVTWYAWLHA